MAFPSIETNRFVKGEDLNHHGTLFAGRSAEWFVEAGLMAASLLLPSENIVCVKIHGMEFTSPIPLGSVAKFVATAAKAGRSSLTVNIRVTVNNRQCIDGFITYVNVDKQGRPFPHGIELIPETEEERELQARAAALPR